MRRPDPLPQPDRTAIASEETLLESIGDLFEDGRTLVEAELNYQSKRLIYGLSRSKGIVVLLLLGVALSFFALMALIVGLLLALTPLLTPWGSLGVVAGLTFLAAIVCFLGAVTKFRRAKAVLLGSESSK